MEGISFLWFCYVIFLFEKQLRKLGREKNLKELDVGEYDKNIFAKELWLSLSDILTSSEVSNG